ncbi:MAG: ABC transporter permease [Euryhalocaulis sp.]|uniref:MlaE family ABC transporter permease n=1 Tax=Euryhalocaulis sp. TaxID=2744307 RepID=UPI0017ED4594|nr:ABC transporter permease [Euryhalocaulis sp.]MBA4801657.1 ABC transporter permease [Euryhalocaulis sp.]
MGDDTGVSIESEDGVLRVRPTGDWTVRTIREVIGDIDHAAEHGEVREYVINVSELGRMDTSGALMLGRPSEHAETYRVEGDHPYAERLINEALEHHGEGCEKPHSGPGLVELFERTGQALVTAFRETYDTLVFFGRTVVTFGKLLAHPEKIRWTSTVHVMEQAGLNALPIVATLAFFIGAVVAFIGANQLALFGASVFTVELVSISILREFGVIITAILLAGRSDSAFTAQIGAMRMQQEIDAMRVMGLDPYIVLVIPRLIAILIMMPLLTFVAMLMGIFGGMMVVWWDLGFSPGYFISRMYDTTAIGHFWAGIAKAPVFAIVIAVIGCRQGLNVGGSVESLGKRTTASVVQSIFAVVVIDAIFALLYLEMGV